MKIKPYLQRKEEMLAATFNLVLVNLCSANLLSPVCVKSVSIVHNAYAVAAGQQLSKPKAGSAGPIDRI